MSAEAIPTVSEPTAQPEPAAEEPVKEARRPLATLVEA